MTSLTGAYVTFRLAGRAYACPLGEVREVVRATGVEPLLGAVPPVTGILEVRGEALPVADVRPAGKRAGTADVIVLLPMPAPIRSGAPGLDLEGAGVGALGLVVDEVLDVLAAADLAAADAPSGLPPFVLEVRRGADGHPVLVVDPRRLVAGVTSQTQRDHT